MSQSGLGSVAMDWKVEQDCSGLADFPQMSSSDRKGPWEWKSPADFDSQNGRMGPRMGPMGRKSPIEWLIVGLNG